MSITRRVDRLLVRQRRGEARAAGRGRKHGSRSSLCIAPVRRAYSAADRSTTRSIGKVHTTVVPWPTAESIVTVPPCSSTNERTSDRPRPAPRCCEPSECDLEPVEHLVLHLGRDAGAGVGHREHHRVWPPLGRQVTVPPAGEKPTALASRLNSTWRTRRSSATKLPMSPAARDVERNAVLDQPVLHALGGGFHGLADVDQARLSFIAPASMVARSRMLLMMASSALVETVM